MAGLNLALQRNWFENSLLGPQIDYWKEVLAEPVATLNLPMDQARPPIHRSQSATETLHLSLELSHKLRDLSRAEGVTLFATLLAAFQILLGRYTDQQEFLFGMSAAGRRLAETKDSIESFVNTLILRADLSGRPTFRNLLRRVNDSRLKALANADVPFEKLVEMLYPERSATSIQLLQTIVFSPDSQIEPTFSTEQLEGDVPDLDSGTAKFDLTFLMQNRLEGLRVVTKYDPDLFFPGTIQRLLQRYELLLQLLTAQPDMVINQLFILSEAEEKQVLVDWNLTGTTFPSEASLQSLFEAQVERTPQEIALSFGGDQLTYTKLNERANQLAHYLVRLGVAPGQIVGVSLESSIELIVALVAVIKSGAAYLPLDLTYPRERLGFMLEDAAVAFVITQKNLWEKLGGSGVVNTPDEANQKTSSVFETLRVISLQTDAATIAAQSSANPTDLTRADDCACLFYTSGSTGRPKGTLIPHRAISRLVLQTNYVSLNTTDRVAQASNISFDGATFEIWGALLNGALLVGVSKEVALSPRDFLRQLSKEGITTLFLTTSLFNLLAAEIPSAFRSLRYLLFGGEKVTPTWVRKVLAEGPPQQMLHVYGPTEATTFATWYRVEEVPERALTIPIGRPISNTEIFLLDQEMHPVPIGVPGEIYIGGPGLALGYLHSPELTNQRFIANPFKEGERLYKTGDIARFLPDGNIEFLERRDQQVKIRGFRIELAEIEAALLAHPGVKESVVLVREDEPGQKRLVAYWVSSKINAAPTPKVLRRHLQQTLPDYMLPAIFQQLEALPLTPNGKINWAALPKPNHPCIGTEISEEGPQGPMEIALAEIWRNILDVRDVRRTDSFFEWGGDSLLAVRFLADIQRQFGKQLPLDTLFQAPTLEQLAAAVARPKTPPKSLIVELQPQGHERPIFWIHSLGGDGGGAFFYYRKLAELLGMNQPSYGIRCPEVPLSTIEEMAERYIQEMRCIQQVGPYHLGGFCFGGIVAFEMARQLRAQNVGTLILMESAPPSRPNLCAWNLQHLLAYLRNLQNWAADLNPKHARRLLSGFKRKSKATARLARNWLSRYREAPKLEEVMDMSEYPKQYVMYAQAHWDAFCRYHPEPFAGKAILLRASKQAVRHIDPDLGWGPLAQGGVHTLVIPGNHENILQEPRVQFVAKHLKACLNELQHGPEAAG